MVAPRRNDLDRPRGASPLGQAAPKEQRFLDLLLTAPVFVVYHLGVVFLEVRNGFDPITDALLSVLAWSLPAYLGITAGLAAALAIGVRVAGVHRAFQPARMAIRLGEAIVYAFSMAIVARSASSWALWALGPKAAPSPLAAVILSFGAGFWEEVAFRVVLFGAVAWLIRKRTRGPRAWGYEAAWAIVAAAAFSAVHYVGSLSDPFTLGSFVFRWTCGVFLTVIYRFRGFATAVWTHALYDVGVMAL